MSFDLSQLKFNVDTSSLAEAVQMVGQLATAVAGVTTPLKNMATAGAGAAKGAQATAKATKDTTQATNEQTPAIEKNTGATKENIKAQEKLQTVLQKQDAILKYTQEGFNKGQARELARAQAAGANEVALKKLADTMLSQSKIQTSVIGGVDATTQSFIKQQSIIEKQETKLKYMLQGFTRTQSTTLAMAEAAKYTTVEMERLMAVLSSQGKVTGNNPLDKSLGAMKALKAEMGYLREANRQIEAFKKNSPDESTMLSLSTKQSKALYQAKQSLIEQFKSQQGQFEPKNITQADGSIRTEIARYKDLQKAVRGLNTEYIETAKSRNALASTTKSADQLRYLARATSVQLGDIGVSLAGGQNPLRVFLQQGDQMRGIFAQVGASAKEMDAGLSDAFKQIVLGFKDVALVLGKFVVTAFADAGKAIASFIAESIGLNAALSKFYAAVGENSAVGSFVKALEPITRGIVAAAIGGTLVALVGLALAYKEIISTSKDLSVALATSGGALAMTKNEALATAKSMAGALGTQTQITEVITSVAKAGNIGRDALVGVTKAALELEKVGGIAVEETVKQYSKLADDPAKALSEVALKTGQVSVAVLDKVDSLIKEGKATEAVTLAIEEMNRVNGVAAKQMRDDMSPLERLWSNMKEQLSALKQEAYNFAESSKVITTLTGVWNALASAIVLAYAGMKMTNVLMENMKPSNIANRLNPFADLNEANKQSNADAVQIGKDLRKSAKDIWASFNGVASGADARVEAEKTYINVMQAGQVVRKEVSQAAVASTLAEVKARNAFIESEKKFLTTSNMSNERRNKAKADAIAKIKEETKLLGSFAGQNKEDLARREKDIIAGIEEQYKPRKEPKAKKTEAEKAEDAALKFFNGLVDRVDDKLPTFTEDLAKLKLVLDKGMTSEENYNIVRAKYLSMQPDAIKKRQEETEAIKKNNEQTEKSIALLLKINEERRALDKKYTSLFEEDSASSAAKERELQFRDEMIGKTEEQKTAAKLAFDEQEQLLEIARQKTKRLTEAREEYNKLLEQDPSRKDVLTQGLKQAEDQINAAALRRAENVKESSQIAIKELEDAKLTKFSESLADAVMTGLKEGGKAGRKKLRDLIVAELEKTFVLSITANIKALLGGLGGGGKQGGGLLDGLLDKGLNYLFDKGSDLLGGLFGGGASQIVPAVGATGTTTTLAGIESLSTGVTTLGNAIAPLATGAPIAANGLASLLPALGPAGWVAAGALALFAIFGFGKDKVPTVLNDLALFNNSLVGLPFLDLSLGSDAAAQGLRDVMYGLENATPTMRKLASETIQLSIELARATGDIQTARNLERNIGTRGMSKEEIAVYDYNLALKDQIEAARAGAAASQAAAQAEEQLAKTRWDLAGKLNILLGRTTSKEFDRATQLAATTDASSLEMLKLIFQMEDLTEAVDLQYAALERSIAAERKLADARLASAVALQNILKTAKEATTVAPTRAKAQASFATLLALAKSSGLLPSADAVKPLLDVLSKPATELFSSFEDYQRDFYRTANDINEMSSLADKQVSIEQQTIDRLDAQLAAAKAQVDALKGVDTSVKDVTTAVNDFNAAMQALAAAKSSTGSYNFTAPSGSSSGGGGGSYGGGGSSSAAASPTFEDIAGQENKDIVAAYREYYNRNPDEVGYENFIKSQLTGDKLMQAILGASAIAPEGQDYKTAVSKGYDPLDPKAKFLKPKAGSDTVTVDGSFAQGINEVPYDMVAQIHQGERILPAADNRELFERLSNRDTNNAVLVAELRAVKEELAGLRHETRSNVKHNMQTATILDDLTRGQQTLNVTTV